MAVDQQQGAADQLLKIRLVELRLAQQPDEARGAQDHFILISKQEAAMDTTVRPDLVNRWGVTDLMERTVCSIIRDSDQQFWIILTAEELPRMIEVSRGPFHAVEGAMDAIETNLRGSCRHGATAAPAPSTVQAHNRGSGSQPAASFYRRLGSELQKHRQRPIER